MYQVGNQVLYGVHGICTVAAIESMRFGKTRGRYYCLQPDAQPDARYYVPVDNEAAVGKMRPLMDAQAVTALLRSESNQTDAWISEENPRKQRYRELLTGADMAGLLQMICTVYRHKFRQEAQGKKLHQCDEGFLKDAERMLNSEFSHALNLQPEQVRDHILGEMGIRA